MMRSPGPSGFRIRQFEADDLLVVSRHLAAALNARDRQTDGAHDPELDLGLVLDSLTERTWILWRKATPMALLHLSATGRLGGGFERISWLCDTVPPESVQIHVMVGARRVVRCTVAEFCRNHGIQWRQPATVGRSAGADAVRGATRGHNGLN